jgi:hypothetical protein
LNAEIHVVFSNLLKQDHSERLVDAIIPISNPANAPIAKIDKKSTVRMLAAPDEILK